MNLTWSPLEHYGARWSPRRPTEPYGDLGNAMENYVTLWSPVELYGALWGPTEIPVQLYGARWNPITKKNSLRLNALLRNQTPKIYLCKICCYAFTASNAVHDSSKNQNWVRVDMDDMSMSHFQTWCNIKLGVDSDTKVDVCRHGRRCRWRTTMSTATSTSIPTSFARSFILVHSLVHSFVCSFVCLFVCWLAPLFVRSVRSFVCSLAHWLALSFVRSLARSLVCSFVRSFDRSVGRSITHSFVRNIPHESPKLPHLCQKKSKS